MPHLKDLTRGWISKGVGPTGVQARIKVAGMEHSRWFANGDYGGDCHRTVAAARRWLDSVAAHLPSRYAGALREHPSPRKRSGLPTGITEVRQVSSSGKEMLRLQVVWHDGTKRRVKSFTVGTGEAITAARYKAALRASTAFRQKYERARQAGLPTDDRAMFGETQKRAYALTNAARHLRDGRLPLPERSRIP